MSVPTGLFAGPDDVGDRIPTDTERIAELYEFRLMYNAMLFNEWAKLPGNPFGLHKSTRHADKLECFGGGWFVVLAYLPRAGQITNHYRIADWNLFRIPREPYADMWDGHTPMVAAQRMRWFLERNC